MEHQVTYEGFLQTVTRTFDSRARAVQWARQVGVERIAKIRAGSERAMRTIKKPLDPAVIIKRCDMVFGEAQDYLGSKNEPSIQPVPLQWGHAVSSLLSNVIIWLPTGMTRP